MDYVKILYGCIHLMEYSNEKTLTAGTICCVLKILYPDYPNLQTLITNGNKYLWQYSTNSKLTNYNIYRNIIDNFMANEAKDIANKVFRINKGSVAFLCGVGDTLTNQVQQFE